MIKEKIKEVVNELKEEKPLVAEFSCAAFGDEESWVALKKELATQHTPEDGEE